MPREALRFIGLRLFETITPTAASIAEICGSFAKARTPERHNSSKAFTTK
jgi:hypothetical protein